MFCGYMTRIGLESGVPTQHSASFKADRTSRTKIYDESNRQVKKAVL